MVVSLWLRPWAWFAPQHRRVLVEGTIEVPAGQMAPLYLFAPASLAVEVEGSTRSTETVAQMLVRADDGAGGPQVPMTLAQLAFPLRRTPAVRIGLQQGTVALLGWPEAPERVHGDAAPVTDDEHRSRDLMLRAEAVWDRISDVDDLLTDPAILWPALRDRWTGRDPAAPKMDVIVRQARDLDRVIAALGARPRRVLRRVHQPVPLARVQEVDRRTMLWLARQPGETLEERAGDRQRVLAVAREEDLDTLENRVLRAYCTQADRHGRDYLARNRTRRDTRRARRVEAFAQHCHRLARDLADRGVRLAEPGVNPNFVLQENPAYRAVWLAWEELRRHDRVRDELWQWQARSWEEFCGLALMVAALSVPGAQVVSTWPLWFRDEHRRGQWIDAGTPLGVVYLPGPRLVVEVQRAASGVAASRWAASLWLRVGRLDQRDDALARVPVWPIWAPAGGVVPGEADELARLLDQHGQPDMRGGILLRPAAGTDEEPPERRGDVIAAALGTEGMALSATLDAITAHLANLFQDLSG